ncbi:hypothetical protein [Mycoplasmopsis gallinarum]|nr:hypothetical protein [Mycoplasmopsis gallinarum]
MENVNVNMNSYNQAPFPLPVLKPLVLDELFIKKIKGDKLKTQIILLIAEDEEFVFFINGLEEKNFDNSNPDHISIISSEGMDENGKLQQISSIKGVDIGTIFKIKYFDLIDKIITKSDEIESLPYLGINDQINIVEQITTKLNSNDNLPHLVIIRKKEQN